MREIWVWRDGKMVLKEQASHRMGIYVIRDTIDETWHPSDGKYYTSKSKFRQVTKAHGGIEVGNEKQVTRQTWNRVTREDVAKAVQMVNNGYRPRVETE